MSKFLATVNIFADSKEINHVLSALSKLNNIEEVYEVAGEYDIVTLVCTQTIEEFRDILQKQIMKINGVKSTIVTVLLAPIKGPRCQRKAISASTT